MSRILSIEDEADFQHLLGSALFANGYEVHYAFNGKEGYEKVMALHPDIIILDLMLPIMNGVDVLKLLRENRSTRDIPVIVMTACGDSSSILESSVKALGALEYIRKPFAIEDLLFRIKAVLSGLDGKKPTTVEELKKGVVRADPRYRTVWVNDQLVATLPPQRFEVLKVLIEETGEVRKDRLLTKVWGKGGNPNTLEKTIQRLREDFGPNENQRIQTTANGYQLIG